MKLRLSILFILTLILMALPLISNDINNIFKKESFKLSFHNDKDSEIIITHFALNNDLEIVSYEIKGDVITYTLE